MKDLAFLESLNAKLVTELDASVALEKELRERIRVLLLAIGMANDNYDKKAKELEELQFQMWCYYD